MENRTNYAAQVSNISCGYPESGAAGNVPPNAEVVVTDSSCTEEFYDKVSASNIPLVMPEWLVQSIITGERASYTGHDRYKVNIGTEEDE